jgi:glycosyltransferase involved in cell wall biosynthesis
LRDRSAIVDESPIRIGFLGFDKYLKGWSVFERLAVMMQGDIRYEFVHLGHRSRPVPFISFEQVHVTHSRRNAMIEAAREHRLDAVLVWPAWPETYSFVVFEAIAAGALVITNPRSGNVAAAVGDSTRGVILDDESKLGDFLADGSLQRLCLQRRSNGFELMTLAYSGCSAAIGTQQVEA